MPVPHTLSPSLPRTPEAATTSDVAKRAEHGFPSLVRLRGLKFVHQDRVSADPDPQNDAVWLTIDDDATCEVMVDWSRVHGDDDDELVLSCTCRVAAEDEPCPHQWAALLYLDERGLAGGLPGTGRLAVHRVRPAAELGRAPGRPPRPWRRTVDALRADASRGVDAPPTRTSLADVYFVIDSGGMRADTRRAGRAPLRVTFYQQQGGDYVPWTLRPKQVGAEAGERMRSLRILADLAAQQGKQVLVQGVDWLEIPHSMLPVVVPVLCRDGRLGWLEDAETGAMGDPFRAVTWDDGPAFRLVLVGEVEAAESGLDGGDGSDGEDGGGERLRISARLERPTGDGTERLTPAELEFLFAGGVALQRHRALRVADAGRVGPWLAQLGTDGLIIESQEADAALQEIWQLPDLPDLRLPESYRWPVEPVESRAVLSLAEPRGGGSIPATVRFEYGEFVARPGDPRKYWARFGDGPTGQRTLVARDATFERRLVGILRRDGVDVDPDGVASIPAHSFAVAAARWSESGWRLDVEGRSVRAAADFKARITSGIDWFDVDGSMRFGNEQVGLPELLQAVRDQRRFVRLDDGTLGLLPGEWLERFGGLAMIAEESARSTDGGALRFGAHQSLLLDALLAADAASADIELDETFRAVRRRLARFDELEPSPTPEGFHGELRPYQEVGLAWLELLADLRLGGCLADDMGLGKTIQVLAHVWQRVDRGLTEGRPSLLVVPRTLLSNWRSEAERFTPGLEVRVYHGVEREELLDGLGRDTLLVTTYGTLLRDILKLREIEFDVAALDEAQAIKNAQSKRAKACRLLKARHRLALTGTPVENHLGELWSILEFLNPTLLGRLPSLADHAGKDRLADGAVDMVSRTLRPLILRRTKDEVLTDLPEKTEQTLYCDLRRAERLRYEQLRDYYRKSLMPSSSGGRFEGSKILVLEALLRLRQAACHPGLLDAKRKGQTSAKLEVLVERLQELTAEGHKVLVYSQFTKLLAIVEERMKSHDLAYEYLDGRTRDRQERVDHFQTDPDCRIFLISLRAGGLGLNLTAASYVFLLDPWWNPAVESQAIDRTHRIGQTRPVFAYRLIARDTVEEKILQLQAKKRALADAVVARDERFLKNLTSEDLELLLS